MRKFEFSTPTFVSIVTGPVCKCNANRGNFGERRKIGGIGTVGIFTRHERRGERRRRSKGDASSNLVY